MMVCNSQTVATEKCLVLIIKLCTSKKRAVDITIYTLNTTQ